MKKFAFGMLAFVAMTGSALAADGRAGMAMAVTQIATAAAALAWMLVEWVMKRKPSVLGIALKKSDVVPQCFRPGMRIAHAGSADINASNFGIGE